MYMQSSILEGCVLFCIGSTCSVLPKNKSLNWYGLLSKWKLFECVLMFYFVKKIKNQENVDWVEISTRGITKIKMTLALWHYSNIQCFTHAKEFSWLWIWPVISFKSGWFFVCWKVIFENVMLVWYVIIYRVNWVELPWVDNLWLFCQWKRVGVGSRLHLLLKPSSSNKALQRGIRISPSRVDRSSG